MQMLDHQDSAIQLVKNFTASPISRPSSWSNLQCSETKVSKIEAHVLGVEGKKQHKILFPSYSFSALKIPNCGGRKVSTLNQGWSMTFYYFKIKVWGF